MKTIIIGVSSAVLEYNHGKEGIYELMKLIGLSIGEVQQKSTKNIMKRFKRVKLHNKVTPAVKRRRKDLRSIKKKWTDKNKEQENKFYETGGF